MITKAEFLKLSSKPATLNPKWAGGLWLDRYFTRKISPLAAYLLASVNVSANIATLAFFALGLFANLLLAIPVWWTPLAVLALYAVVRVLDEADGRLARYFKTQSKFGEVLDIFSELLLHSTFFIALGIRLYLETESIWALVLAGIGALPYLYEGPWVKLSDELVGPFEASQPATFWSWMRTTYVNYDYILTTALLVPILYGLQTLLNAPSLVLMFFALHVSLSFLIKVALRFIFVFIKSGRGALVGEGNALPRRKILPLPELVKTLEMARNGKRVVYFSGVFDLFHFGHFNALKKSAGLGDILVMQIDGDLSTKERKGPDRPYLPESVRAEMIAAFAFVDYVFISNLSANDLRTLEQIRPDVMVRAKRNTETDEQRASLATEWKAAEPRMEVIWLEETPEISTSMLFPAVARSGAMPISRKSPTVSVGISAYNEEKNIRGLLESILGQTEDGFELAEILVVSDGSTDQTADRIREVLDPRVKLVVSDTREGKTTQQNRIMSLVKGDIVVLFDADVIPENKMCLTYLVRPLIGDPTVGMVGAKVLPVAGKTWFENVINHSNQFKAELFEKTRNGDNIFSCHGRARAFSKAFVAEVKWPDIFSEDAYSYLRCKSLGLRFVYSPEATVLFRSPDNFRDYKRQSDRFRIGKKTLYNFFDPRLVNESYKLSKISLVKLFLLYFLRNPVYMLNYLFVMSVAAFTDTEQIVITSRWIMSPSSKKI